MLHEGILLNVPKCSQWIYAANQSVNYATHDTNVQPQVKPCLDLVNSSLLLLTEDERIDYVALLHAASSLFNSEELTSLLNQNYSNGIGQCPSVLDAFRSSKYAKEIIPGCIETCTSAILTTHDDEFRDHISHAALMFLIAPLISFAIYLATFQQQTKRKQLRECALILLGAFMLLGLTLKVVERGNFHCSETLMCPLSTVLITFSTLAISALYLFFTMNMVLELKSFLASLHLNPREFNPLSLNWLHWAAWFGSFVVASTLTIIACLPMLADAEHGKSRLHPVPFMRVCGFETPWSYYVLIMLHLFLVSAAICLTGHAIAIITRLLPLVNYLSGEGKKNIYLYTGRLAALFVCLVMLLVALLATFVAFDRVDLKRVTCRAIRHSTIPRPSVNNVECEGDDFDISCIVYILYALQLCCFIQAVWPLDATLLYNVITLFGSSPQRRAELNRLGQMALFYRERNRGSESILLTETKRPSDISSELGEWLTTNRLIERRGARLPERLLPDLVRSNSPTIRRRPMARKRKRPAWSVKQGFTPHHQRIRNHMDSSEEEDEQTENYHNFFNFSITNETRLSAAIARIDQFGFSTTQSESEPLHHQHQPFHLSSHQEPNENLLDHIRLSDLSSD